MSDGQYISVRETAQILGITERKVMDMIDSNELQAYKIANQFLRLKRIEVMALAKTGSIENESIQFPYTKADRLKDFIYYNDFYIASGAIIIILLTIVLNA